MPQTEIVNLDMDRVPENVEREEVEKKRMRVIYELEWK
jgi:hypothetical protein